MTKRKRKQPLKSYQRRVRRKKLYKRHKDCCYCGSMLKFDEFTIEHIKPLSMSGVNDLTNLAVCCEKCNTDHNQIHNLWRTIFIPHKQLLDHDLCKIQELYSLLENYIYNKQRRINNYVYTIFPTVKFLKEMYEGI